MFVLNAQYHITWCWGTYFWLFFCFWETSKCTKIRHEFLWVSFLRHTIPPKACDYASPGVNAMFTHLNLGLCLLIWLQSFSPILSNIQSLGVGGLVFSTDFCFYMNTSCKRNTEMHENQKLSFFLFLSWGIHHLDRHHLMVSKKASPCP